MLNSLDKSISTIAIKLIRLYQATLSPSQWALKDLRGWSVCSHRPHCSAYWIEAFSRYWAVRWFFYTSERVMSCTWWECITYDPSHLRVVFASGSPVGVPFLKELINDDRYECVWVITQPDAKSWRWQTIQKNIIETTAIEHWLNVPVVKPHSLKRTSKKRWTEAASALDTIRELEADVILVVAYGHIVPQELLDIPHFGCINVHWSLLPLYRGASPLQSVFLDERKLSWITVMEMSLWMDEWAMLSQLEVPLHINDTVEDLYWSIQERWPQHTLNTIWEYAKWRIDPVEQDSSLATYCSKIEKTDWTVTLTDSLSSVFAKYKWYYWWPWVRFTRKRWISVKITGLRVDEDLYATYSNRAWIDNPAIVHLEVRPDWKQSMSRDSFVNWYWNVQ